MQHYINVAIGSRSMQLSVDANKTGKMTKKQYFTGWRNAPTNINTCCNQHDRDYGINGTVSRAKADKRLKNCLILQGHPIKAWVFWLAVRLFGWAFYKNKEIKIDK